MLLADMGALDRSELLGVDARPSAVTAARAGVFDVNQLSDIDVRRRERYFSIQGAQGTISPQLRAHTTWRVEDLCRAEPGGGWDMILCRNVTIYLEEAAAGALWHRLTGRLAPGGYLVTGKAERPPAGLPLRRLAPCIYTLTTGS
jgi:chemotaxis methyl-accepting protein methylase